jgi:hypothetical protein
LGYEISNCCKDNEKDIFKFLYEISNRSEEEIDKFVLQSILFKFWNLDRFKEGIMDAFTFSNKNNVFNKFIIKINALTSITKTRFYATLSPEDQKIALLPLIEFADLEKNTAKFGSNFLYPISYFIDYFIYESKNLYNFEKYLIKSKSDIEFEINADDFSYFIYYALSRQRNAKIINTFFTKLYENKYFRSNIDFIVVKNRCLDVILYYMLRYNDNGNKIKYVSNILENIHKISIERIEEKFFDL